MFSSQTLVNVSRTNTYQLADNGLRASDLNSMMSVFNMLVLVVTALLVKASSETVIQSCECSLCTCTAKTENAAQAATLTTAPTPEPTAAPTPEPTTFSGPWTEYKEKHYKYFPKPILSFKEASQYCRSLRADISLVSIFSQGEVEYVQDLVSRSPADVSIFTVLLELSLKRNVQCRSNK